MQTSVLCPNLKTEMSQNDCLKYDESVRKTIENCLTAQAMIDINAKHLEGLRTECAITAELTQNEIRALETKLVKLFSRQLVAKKKLNGSNNISELKPYPQLRQWLRVVGLGEKSINAICDQIKSFDALLKSSEHEMKDILHENDSREEEIRRILTAIKNLKLSIDRLMAGDLPLELDLHWDSWDRTTSSSNTNSIPSSATASPRISGRNRTMRTSVPSEDLLKSSPLSPPQSAGLWSSNTGSYILNPNSSNLMDSRRPTPPPTPPVTNKKNSNSERKFPTTPPPMKRLQTNLLADPFPLTKSRSHEEHLAHRIEPLDPAVAKQLLLKYITNTNHNHHNSLENLPHHRRRLATEPGLGTISPLTTSPSRSPPVVSPDQQQDNCFSDTPVAPRSPRSHGMAHSIHHRFSTTMKINSTCNLCEKPMFIGYKCKECKYRCHRDCVDKVPNSCGLPNELVDVFKQTINCEERRSPIVISHHMSTIGGSSRTQSEIMGRKVHKKRTHYNHQPIERIALPFSAGHDSSSNTSSCNSSTPSSPALISSMSSTQTPPQSANRHQQFQFPDPISSNSLTYSSTSNTIPYNENYNTSDGITIETKPFSESEVIDTQKSTDSDKTVSGTSGSGSTDSEKTLAGRVDSQDSQASDIDPNDKSWPRQNSLTLREWDIPFDELKVEDPIGTGRFGTVFKGNWHGSVAIKRLNMNNVLDDKRTIESFKQEVATFRKTRHDNLVLFMGACMKPPHLAIVTSLCKGMTLYTHIHLRKDKFNLNRTIIIAQQICQGMGYLHARGIVHKDLKSKNIFYENGKVVITDFGLFSVAKLCVGNRTGDWLTIPKGWLPYLAPELVRSLRIHSQQENEELPFSTATDVYAFGTVWYELLLGEWPFRGQPSEVIIWQVGKGVKQSLINLQASKEIKDLLMMCWSFKVNERTEFSKLYDILTKLPKKRLQRSPSHPIHLLRSAESLF